jgi:hypothetical protein
MNDQYEYHTVVYWLSGWRSRYIFYLWILRAIFRRNVQNTKHHSLFIVVHCCSLHSSLPAFYKDDAVSDYLLTYFAKMCPLTKEEIEKFDVKYVFTCPTVCSRRSAPPCRKHPTFSPIWSADGREGVPPPRIHSLGKVYVDYANFMECTLVYSTGCDGCKKNDQRSNDQRREEKRRVRGERKEREHNSWMLGLRDNAKHQCVVVSTKPR